MLRGDGPQLHGCDVGSGDYGAFFDFAGLRYQRLSHPYLLPYDDCAFEVVIGSAALEHVPNDSKSLKEIYRVLKPGGLFIMTTLPNRYSYTEFVNRLLNRPHHLRTYSLKLAKSMFLHHGFVPVASAYHQVFPSLASTGGIFDWPLVNKVANALSSQNGLLETLWPVKCFASSVFVIEKKVAGIDNGDFDLGTRIFKAASSVLPPSKPA